MMQMIIHVFSEQTKRQTLLSTKTSKSELSRQIIQQHILVKTQQSPQSITDHRLECFHGQSVSKCKKN
jgi:hypothetical protein